MTPTRLNSTTHAAKPSATGPNQIIAVALGAGGCCTSSTYFTMEAELLVVNHGGWKCRHWARAPAYCSAYDRRRLACQRRSVDAVEHQCAPAYRRLMTRRAVDTEELAAILQVAALERDHGNLLADVIGHGSHLGEGEKVRKSRHVAGSDFHCGDHIAGLMLRWMFGPPMPTTPETPSPFMPWHLAHLSKKIACPFGGAACSCAPGGGFTLECLVGAVFAFEAADELRASWQGETWQTSIIRKTTRVAA